MRGRVPMLMELNVLPQEGRGADETEAALARIIDSSGLSHHEKDEGVVLEGSWEQLMAVAKKCHDEVHRNHLKMITMMRAIDDPEAAADSAPGSAAAPELLEDEGDLLIP